MTRRNYQTIPGFFIQDNDIVGVERIDPVLPRFGLIDDSENRWDNFRTKLDELNAHAQPGESYKAIFFGRHGQGYHNVAEAQYGTAAWDDYWAKLNTDGKIVWGPDPELTEIGEAQAASVHALWEHELAMNIPLPQKRYCSPMTRAIRTLEISFDGIVPNDHCKPIIIEDCREEYGVHTCDKRRTRTHLHAAFPNFEIEEGFAEEDELWAADVRETREHVAVRAQKVLDRIFDGDAETFISVTAHGGIINGFVAVTGHIPYLLPTGGIIPMVVKGTAMPTDDVK